MTPSTSNLRRIAATGAFATLLAGCGKPPSGPPPASTAPPQVGTVVVRAEALRVTTELPGRTTPTLSAEVRPQVGGIVKTRPFREGGDVKAGDLLYQIDAATYRAAVDNAQAALDKAVATATQSRIKADRYQELIGIKAISQQDYDDVAATQKQSEADVAAARAMLETSRINLAYTKVTAPISGRIGRSSVTPGALVTASQATALATIQRLDPIYVDVTQSSAALLRLRRALADGRLTKDGSVPQVKLVLDDGSTYAAQGTLQFSEVTVDPSSGSVTLRAVFPNPDGTLLPGMYVRAVIDEGTKPQALLVPQAAVSRDGSGKATAFVVDREGKAEQRAIVVGQAVGDRWVVDSGLSAGDRIVVDGLQKVRPGMTVQSVALTPEAPATPSSPARAIASAAR